MNKFDYKNLTPFKWFVLENFPFLEADFDALTEWQLFCKLGKEINKIIDSQNIVGEQAENLTNAFNNLKNYVDNYFDNLDVQDEINNKLNEMAEDGTLDNILMNYANINKIYNTAVEMISDTNIVKGMKIKTLGYYNINDNGAGQYYITDSVENTDFYITLNNGLYALLIVEDCVNINSLGADTTGATDSSLLFNSVFTIINNRWLSSDVLYGCNTVMCNGKYLWNNQVKMPSCAKLRGSGYTTILTNVENDSALHITYLSNTWPSNFAGNKNDWQYAELISFDKGGLFKNINGSHQGTCIEIGTRTNMTDSSNHIYSVSRFSLNNFRIYNYDTAELVNGFNVYMVNHTHVSYEGNTICVKFGTNSSSGHSNSGEQFSYYNCLFATATTGFLFHQSGFDISLINSHLDFITDIIDDVDNKGYKRMVINQCHIEGFTNLIKKLGQWSMCIISNNNITDNANANTKYFNDIINTAKVIFENNKLLRSGNFATTSNPEYNVEKPNVCLYGDYNIYNHGSKGRMFLGQTNYFNRWLDGLADGDVTLNSSTYINGMLCTLLKSKYLSDTAQIVTDNYLYDGHKSLVLTRNNVEYTEGDKINIHFKSHYLPVTKFLYYASLFVYNSRGEFPFNLRYEFYDEDKNEISHVSYYNNNPANSGNSNEWYMAGYPLEINIPKNVRYFTVTYIFQNLNGTQDVPIGTQFKIGGVVLN